MLLQQELKNKIVASFETYVTNYPIEPNTFHELLSDLFYVHVNFYTNQEAIAEVLGKYDTIIYFDDVLQSICTCQSGRTCHHIPLVLLHMYAQFDNPQTLLVRTVKKPSVLPMSVTAWYDHFEANFSQYQSLHSRSIHSMYNKDILQIESMYEAFYPKMLEDIAAKNATMFSLYQLHAALFTYRKMLEMLASSELVHMTIRLQERLIEPLYEHLLELISFARNNTWDAQSQQLITESIPFFDRLLRDEHGFEFQRLYLYQSLWLHMPITKELIKHQLQQLESIGESTAITVAQIHLSFLLEDDEAALQKVEAMDGNVAIYAMMWLHQLLEKEQWSRMKAWLSVLPGKIRQLLQANRDYAFLEDIIMYYLNHIEEYAMEYDDMPLYEKLLQEWLPYSYPYYDYFLIREKKFALWTELQLLVNTPVQSLDKSILSVVEKEAMECLLPLYHRQIIALIEEKNRKAYREAVKLLRKLRTYYRKLKQQAEWNSYIAQLASRYKRLRAFQEELRKGKGKLIDD